MLSQLALVATLALSSNAALTRRVACPDGVNTAVNGACCVWYAVRDDLQENLFHKQCEAEVHETLRASFHDAIGFSPALAQQGQFAGGGADGSLIKFGDSDEFAFAANAGLEDVSHELKKFADNHNVSYGDIIQFATAVGITNCEAAPSIRTFVGRPDAVAASPPNLVPLPTDSVNDIIARFGDAGISVANALWLLGSHSIAAQNHVDPSVPGTPFDSTPAVFDSQFFLEVLLKGTSVPGTPASGNPGEAEAPIQGEFRLQSDFLLARDPQTCGLWTLPINNVGFIQGVFSSAMTQMSLLGQNQTTLIDCSEVIPTSQGSPKAVTYPPGLSKDDLDFDCSSTINDFPTQPGEATPVPTVPPPNFS